jgi:acyl-CoA reductase-like NAD-dependent aldehyde dehydrogenase
MQSYKMWIGGQFVEAASGKTFPAVNPANGEVFAQIPLGGQAEVDKAVAAAKKALPIWAAKSQAERSKIILKIAEAFKPHIDEFAVLDTMDHGTPAMIAKGMMMDVPADFEYAAQVSLSFQDEVVPGRTTSFNYLQKEPIGVVALITPWNAPLGVVVTKLSAALCMGNTCIIKPPSIDSTTTLKFAEILAQIPELPAGAVNIITGPGSTMGEYISSHPGVDMVTFTGSSETGSVIMASAAKTMKRLAMEAGGKNPFIVMADANIEMAANKGCRLICANSGQICASPGIFWVHEKVYDKFVEIFVAGIKTVKMGDPTVPGTFMGPMVSKDHRDSVERYIQSGIKEGATLLVGGKRPVTPPLDKGYYVEPTVFTNVTADMTIAKEEIFGPVGVIAKFSDADDVVALANNTTYGLTTSIWLADVIEGMRIAGKINSGTVWINDHMIKGVDLPWGGFKQSGFGKENGPDGLLEYTRKKWIGINTAPPMPPPPAK